MKLKAWVAPVLAALAMAGCDDDFDDSDGAAYDPHTRDMISWPTEDESFQASGDSLHLGGTANSEGVYPSDPPTGPTVVKWTNTTTGQSGSALVSRYRASAWPFGVFDIDKWAATVPLAAGINVISIKATMADGWWAHDELTVEYDPPDFVVTITGPTSEVTFSTDSEWLALSGTWTGALEWVTALNAANNATDGRLIQEGEKSWSMNVLLKSGVNLITITGRTRQETRPRMRSR